MAQGDIPVTMAGNLVADPELRYTPGGAAVASFRVASTPRKYDSQAGGWVDGDPVFMACSAWNQLGENAAQSLEKGMRVIVSGRLRQRSYETQGGEKRTVMGLEVDEVGPSLKYASAQVTRNPREGGGAQYGQNTAQQARSTTNGAHPNTGAVNDPWGPQGATEPPF